MITRTLGRLGATAAVAVGLLVVTALPAAAAPVRFDIVAGSTFTINGNTYGFSGHSTANVCAANSQQSHVIPDITGSTITLTPGDYHIFEGEFDPPPVGGTIFRFQLVPGTATTTGTISGSNISLPVTLSAVFKDCAGTSTVCRTNPVTATLSTASYAGSNPPVSSDTATLSGTSTTAITTQIGCNSAIRAQIHNFFATVSLSLHVP